jgi:hypothetical protein
VNAEQSTQLAGVSLHPEYLDSSIEPSSKYADPAVAGQRREHAGQATH